MGTHRVPIKYSQSFGFVDYKIDPSYVTVVIYNKISGKREVNYEILHRENLDSKLDISDVTLSKTEVTIKGNEDTLGKVGYVKALVDLNNLVNPKAGEVSIKNCKLVAYDDNGNAVDVEIIPEVVQADLKLISSSKTVPIKVIPKNNGKLALGYAISSLTPSSNSIEIYGNEESIAKVEYVPVYVDINGVSENKSYTVNIDKPAGVRELSLKTITVSLAVTKENQKEVSNVRIVHNNLDPSLTVITTSESDVKTTVLVKGSEEALKTLDETKVVATIDLANYTSPGEYEVDVKASGEDLKLTYEPKTTKVKVIIRKK